MNTNTPSESSKQRLISPQHLKIRNAFRVVGPVVLAVGALFTAVAVISFIVAFSSNSGPPKLFWLAFIGMPLMFVGTVLCMFGFMGAMSRYVASENAPVAA